jgi:nucleotide-binding universal stress UspA family protein
VYNKVLVPFDGSAGSWNALRKALLLASEHGAQIAALSIVDQLPRFAAVVGEVTEEIARQKDYFAEIQTQATDLARQQGIELKTETQIGHAAESIVKYAHENGFDLIVIGHSGHSGIWGTLLGSTSGRVVNHAQCDVLVAR